MKNLRPFDLEAAKRGEPFEFIVKEQHVYVTEPNDFGEIVTQSVGGRYTIGFMSQYYMTPLAWVEERPVYNGDKLYHGGKLREISSISETDVFCYISDKGIAWAPISEFTWNKPREETVLTAEIARAIFNRGKRQPKDGRFSFTNPYPEGTWEHELFDLGYAHADRSI